ncbi:4-phosphoerythronate dehydrogenase [Pseudohongiella spirulinae]|uniref:Erythronate-4-phosphate dehydrogenase n=1 Tax=Pseudohongiella spirulinae TaxID=1249552 RepID=A0A0S2KDN9_9GAMM|nr:4-phosphoerythronate dehydrogenase [Pseudohongiella spirulinae]ALO46082.1 Erythronate-4-phosphate dehydrogenase [Pseudohongiella spirulinae]
MKIVADQNILAIDTWKMDHHELHLVAGREISPAHVKDADALLVRSITRVDRELLRDSRVRFVGTATSGTDHLDLEWLASKGIKVADAAGSNANSVAEYVIACLAELIRTHDVDVWQKTIAIVGAGHVGSALGQRLHNMGMKCVACDPHQQLLKQLDYVSLHDALQADIVCLHTPLVENGKHPTRYMINKERLANMRKDAVLINAGRGEVVNNAQLLQHLRCHDSFLAMLDVWENEPSPDSELLEQVFVGTPHIAGYSVEAKLAASRCIVDALCQAFALDNSFVGSPAHLPRLVQDITHTELQQTDQQIFAELINQCLSLSNLTQSFRRANKKADPEKVSQGKVFDKLRKQLAERREFSACHVQAAAVTPQVASWLHSAGFVLQA